MTSCLVDKEVYNVEFSQDDIAFDKEGGECWIRIESNHDGFAHFSIDGQKDGALYSNGYYIGQESSWLTVLFEIKENGRPDYRKFNVKCKANEDQQNRSAVIKYHTPAFECGLIHIKQEK